MAVFRIIHTRKNAPEGPPEFDVAFIEGTLAPGDAFRVFDTHHPLDFTVREVRHDQAGLVTLVCNSYIGWDEQFAGCEVDTAHPDRAKRGYS